LSRLTDRNERRNITIGQKAMGYAMLFPLPAQQGVRGETCQFGRFQHRRFGDAFAAT
jgi:hypothetical protein